MSESPLVTVVLWVCCVLVLAKLLLGEVGEFIKWFRQWRDDVWS